MEVGLLQELKVNLLLVHGVESIVAEVEADELVSKSINPDACLKEVGYNLKVKNSSRVRITF
jgi:hypothetical protein